MLVDGKPFLILGGGVWGVVALTGGKKSTLPKDLQQAIRIIEGSARSMGLEVNN